MGIGIGFIVFMIILYIVVTKKEKKQKEIEEKISNLVYQRQSLCSIVRFLLNSNLCNKLTNNDKESIEFLMNDILAANIDSEQSTNRLEFMYRYLYNLIKNNEDNEIDPMFKEDNKELFKELGL